MKKNDPIFTEIAQLIPEIKDDPKVWEHFINSFISKKPESVIDPSFRKNLHEKILKIIEQKSQKDITVVPLFFEKWMKLTFTMAGGFAVFALVGLSLIQGKPLPSPVTFQSQPVSFPSQKLQQNNPKQNGNETSLNGVDDKVRTTDVKQSSPQEKTSATPTPSLQKNSSTPPEKIQEQTQWINNEPEGMGGGTSLENGGEIVQKSGVLNNTTESIYADQPTVAKTTPPTSTSPSWAAPLPQNNESTQVATDSTTPTTISTADAPVNTQLSQVTSVGADTVETNMNTATRLPVQNNEIVQPMVIAEEKSPSTPTRVPVENLKETAVSVAPAVNPADFVPKILSLANTFIRQQNISLGNFSVPYLSTSTSSPTFLQSAVVVFPSITLNQQTLKVKVNVQQGTVSFQ